jgi:predicted ATP-grasp superfamily ATP-dependent carboligase
VEANDDALLAMLDKDRTYAIAREAGVPAPWTATVRTPAEAAAAAGQAQYPCALKALYSHVFRRHFGSQTKVLVARDRAALEAHFESTLALGIDVLVTEIVPGADDQFCSYYTYLDERGEPLFHFTKRKLRQWPTRFGLICYQVTNWEPAVVDAGVRFAKAAALRGVVNVEFKRDSRDGVYKLIECNHRFTAANELVRFAGIDIPLLAYNRVAGRPDSPVGSYRRGVRMWDPVEDVRALLEYRRNGELTARTWARSLMHRQHFPLLRWDDPLPTVMSNLRHGRGLARQLTKSRRGRALSAPA